MIPTLPAPGETLAPEDYTLKQFESDILDIIMRFPDNRQPRNEEDSCQYRQENYDGLVEWDRYIIGQWLHERGHDYSGDWEGQSANTVLLRLGYPNMVASRALVIQGRADKPSVVWRDLLILA